MYKPKFGHLLVFALLPSILFGKIGLGLQMQLGNPSGATANAADHAHYLIQRAQYAMDYCDTQRTPNWVSWDLTSDDVGSSGRGSFSVDTNLPVGFTLVATTAYSGSGYDRGHMCPSGDRTITVADNDVTFYMTNMVPQTPDNNQGVWASFESYCRTLASAGNEVLIICGPSDFSSAAVASGVKIPGAVWKIAVVVPAGTGTALSRITTGTRVIAIKIPNIAGVRSDPWQNYLTSPALIEASLGYNFFSGLPASVSNYLRLAIDGQPAPTAPVIVSSPVSQTVSVGAPVTFTASITGSLPITYQWRKNGIPFSSASSFSLISATVADSGTYDLSVTNSLGAATTNAVVLTVTETFASWASVAGLSGGGAFAAADPDGDGIPNLIEYALGGNPLQSDKALLPSIVVLASHLTFTFNRAQSLATYTVEASSDLVTWSTLATNPGIVGQSVSVTDTADLSQQTQRFLRLRVTLP